MGILDKLSKAGSVKTAYLLSESTFFSDRDIVTTSVPAVNIALSGDIDGGLKSGLTVLAGPSRHFKSNLGLVCVSAYLNKYPDAACLFYDSEFGITPDYLKNQGVDPSRVLHIPIMHIEELKFDLSNRLKEIKKGDKVIIFIDSVGNLASKKEVDDALNENSAADMTRAKQLKSFFRIVTPHFTVKDIPCIVINHTYQTQEMYSKAVISGGTGVMYSCDTAIILGRSQDKAGTEIMGYTFTMNMEKSRMVKEKSKIPLQVTFAGGIEKYSGMLDLAMEAKFVVKPNMGWYQLVNIETGELIGGKVREKDTRTEEFLGSVLANPKFKEWVCKKYKLERDRSEVSAEEIEEDLDTDLESQFAGGEE